MSMVKLFVKGRSETKEMARIPQVYAFQSLFFILSTYHLPEGTCKAKCYAYSAVVRATSILHASNLPILGVHMIAT